MGDTWVTDLSHFPEDDEDLASLPTPAINLALHLRSIVEWMTSRPLDEFELTNVYCRRSPDRKRCIGQIIAEFTDEPDTIRWECPACGDNGLSVAGRELNGIVGKGPWTLFPELSGDRSTACTSSRYHRDRRHCVRLSERPPSRQTRSTRSATARSKQPVTAGEWPIWDWLRSGLIAAGFLSSVRAISIPFPRSDH